MVWPTVFLMFYVEFPNSFISFIAQFYGGLFGTFTKNNNSIILIYLTGLSYTGILVHFLRSSNGRVIKVFLGASTHLIRETMFVVKSSNTIVTSNSHYGCLLHWLP